jgi:hypothetical protein
MRPLSSTRPGRAAGTSVPPPYQEGTFENFNFVGLWCFPGATFPIFRYFAILAGSSFDSPVSVDALSTPSENPKTSKEKVSFWFSIPCAHPKYGDKRCQKVSKSAKNSLERLLLALHHDAQKEKVVSLSHLPLAMFFFLSFPGLKTGDGAFPGAPFSSGLERPGNQRGVATNDTQKNRERGLAEVPAADTIGLWQ